MDIALTKNIFGNLEISPSKLIGVYGPRYVEGEGISDSEIRKFIKNPIGTRPLNEIAKGRKNVLIVTDDNTRATPLTRLIPPVLEELIAAGVPEEGITFLIGLGAHRHMDQREKEIKFGTMIANRYRIINHVWKDPESLVSLGTCELGFEVIINKLVQESDIILSIGSIFPHATTGFSGGGKSIIPGICGEKTIEDTHWMALNYSIGEILGNYNNPVREAIDFISRKIHLRMIINTILFNRNKIYGLVVGDMELAHKKGVELCREVYSVSIPEIGDIVIAEAYPADINLRQAIKAICAADLVCRDGGVVILPAECAEGIAPQFPEFEKYGFKDPDFLYQEVEKGEFKHKLMAYTLVAIGRIISKRIHAILISPNIDPGQAERMGFTWAIDLQDAVKKAFKILGENSKMIVLKQASGLLPILLS
jgi:nickel-dependent lactate racemase